MISMTSPSPAAPAPETTTRTAAICLPTTRSALVSVVVDAAGESNVTRAIGACSRAIADAANDGYDMKTGVECEFFLLANDGSSKVARIAMIAMTTSNSMRVKPCWMERFIENSRLKLG